MVSMNFFKPFAIGRDVYLTPRVTARYALNDSVPRMYRNLAGGTDGHYMPQRYHCRDQQIYEFMENMVFYY